MKTLDKTWEGDMNTRSWLGMVPFLGLVLLGCAGYGSHVAPAADKESVARDSASYQGAGSNGLTGTEWRLEDLGGVGVVDSVEATLQFPEAGRAAGSGSCNRFFGTASISGDSITFGPLGSGRMACAEAVQTQEGRYLKALQDAERFTLDGPVLLIYSKGLEKPLRFIRKEP
jgi:heat shock protein HslJ